MITDKDLEIFGYYEMVDAYPTKKCTYMEMVEEFRVTMGQDRDPNMSVNLIDEEYKEWNKTWDFPDSSNNADELKELADLVYVIFGYANSMGWDLDEAIQRVHSNNMERCVWPDGKVYKREDGKILKRPDAKKVDLSDLV